MKNIKAKLERLSQIIFIGLLGYMPLHIFISTVVGANLGWLDLLKVLKDVIGVAGFAIIFGLSINKKWFKQWLNQKLVIAMIIYAFINLLLSLIKPTANKAEILGLALNLRFLIFFLYGWLIMLNKPSPNFVSTALKVVFGASAVVILFGLFQYFFLPNDTLAHIGYVRSNGVLPAFFIDDKPNLERVMSTLRDPNSLGAYLIIVICLAATKLQTKQRVKWAIYIILAGMCLFLTFSRSSLIGLIASLIIFFVLSANHKLKLNPKIIKFAGLALVAVTIVLGAALVIERNSYFVKNIIFHADQNTVAEDPNQLRVRFFKESVTDIAKHPLGSGPGTAGLASIKNDVQGTRLTENYYLQVGIETGIIGLILFVCILVLVGLNLYAQQNDILAIALLAALIGISLTNFLVHIWSNEAVAYTWWGLAGLVYKKRISLSD